MINQEEKDANAFDNAVSPKRPLKIEDSIGYSPSKKQKQSLPLLYGSNITMNSPDPLSKHHNCNEIQIKIKRKPNDARLILSSRNESVSIDKSDVGVSPTTLFYILDFDNDKENINDNVRNNKFIHRPIKNHPENKKLVGNDYKYRDDCSSISSLGCLVLGSTSSNCNSKQGAHLTNSYATRGQIYEPREGVAVVDAEEGCYSNFEVVSYSKSKDVSPSSVAEMPYDDYTCIDSYPTNLANLPLPLHSYSSPTIFTASNAPTTTPPNKSEISEFRQNRIVPVANVLSDQTTSADIPVYSCVKDGTKPTPPSSSSNRGTSKAPTTTTSTTTSNNINVTDATRSQLSSISPSSALGTSSSISRSFNNAPSMSNHNLNPIVLTKASKDSLHSLSNSNNTKKKEDRHSSTTDDEKEDEDVNFNAGRTIFEFKDNSNNSNNSSSISSSSSNSDGCLIPDPSDSTMSMKPPLSLAPTLSPNGLPLPLPFFHPTNIIPANLAPNSHLKHVHSNRMNRNGRSMKYQSAKLSNNDNNNKCNKNISTSSNDTPLGFIHKNSSENSEADDSEFDVLSLTHEFNLLAVDHNTDNNNNIKSYLDGNTTTPATATTVTSPTSNVFSRFRITPNTGLDVTATTPTALSLEESVLATTSADEFGDALEEDCEESANSNSPSDSSDASESTAATATDTAADSGADSGAVTYGNSTPEKAVGGLRPKTHHSRMKRIKKRLIQSTEESATTKATSTSASISLEGSIHPATDVCDSSADKATSNSVPSEDNKIEKDSTTGGGLLSIDTTSNTFETEECEKVPPTPMNDTTSTTAALTPSTPPGKAPVSTKEAVVSLRRRQAAAGHSCHTRRKKAKARPKMRRTYYYPKLESLVEGVVMTHGFPAWLLDVSVVSNSPLNEEGKGMPSSSVTEDVSSSSNSSDTASAPEGTTMTSRGGKAVSPSTSPPPPASPLLVAITTTADAQFSTTTTFNTPATATVTTMNSSSSSSSSSSTYATSKLSFTSRPGKRQLAPLHSQRGGLLANQATPASLHPSPLLSVLSHSPAAAAAAATGTSSSHALTTVIRNTDGYSHSIDKDKDKDPALSLWYRDQCNDVWTGDASCYQSQSNLPNDHHSIESELFRAIITRNINRMISLLNNCDHYFAIVNLTEEVHGNSFLIVATQQDWKKGVRLLIKRGANINFQNKYGNAALHFACQFGFKEIEKYLRKKGALAHLRNCKHIDCSI